MTLKSSLYGSTRAVLASPTGMFNPMLRGAQVAFAPDHDEGAASDNGPITEAEAISLLTAADEAPDGDAEPEEDEEQGDEAEASADDESEDEAADQAAGEDDAPDEDDPASEDDSAEDEEAEPETPAIEPPRFWSAEEKALFAKAPPEVQQVIAAKDAEYSRQVSLAKEEAAVARKDAEVIAEVRDKIDATLERATQIFRGKWDGVDWAQWAKDAPEEAIAAKFEFDAEQAELHKLQTAQAATAVEEHRQFLQREGLKLAEAVPELADPTEGRNRKAALVNMLTEAGFTPDDLKWAGAKELQIAWEAYQWRQAKAKAKADPPKPKAPEPAKAAAPKKTAGSVRPAAAAPPRKSVIQRRKQEVVGKAMKTGRMDDAVAALMALEGN
jgi:hypothetical protein